MTGIKFMAMAKAGADRKSGARHMRRAAEKLASPHGYKSIPAIKKIIRRNKQRRK